MARAKEGALYAILHAQKHAHYGHPTAKKLLSLASTSVSSGQAEAGRSVSLRLLCEQLEQTQKHLDWLQAELEHLLANDPAVKGLQQIPEFGTTTVAVRRAELGDVRRFARDSPGDCLRRLGYRDSKKVACGRARRSSPNPAAAGSRHMLYVAALRSMHLEGSAFGGNSRRLVERGLKKGSALPSGDAQNAGGCCLFAQTRAAGL